MENHCQCPDTAAIAIANEALDEYGHLIDPDKVTRSRGLMKLSSWFMERVRERYPCPGPQRSDEGYIICPLVKIAGTARECSITDFNEARIILPLRKVADDDAPGHRPGQYL